MKALSIQVVLFSVWRTWILRSSFSRHISQFFLLVGIQRTGYTNFNHSSLCLQLYLIHVPGQQLATSTSWKNCSRSDWLTWKNPNKENLQFQHFSSDLLTTAISCREKSRSHWMWENWLGMSAVPLWWQSQGRKLSNSSLQSFHWTKNKTSIQFGHAWVCFF